MIKKFIAIFLLLTTALFSADYKDGLYVAKSAKPLHGWTSVVELTIVDGKISKVEVENYNNKGLKRTADTAGNSYMKKQYGFDFNDIADNFRLKLLKNSDLKSIDAIAGATLSNDEFRLLSEQALKDAEIGNTKQSVINR